MYEISLAAMSPSDPQSLQKIRQARHLPDLFERATATFLETSGARYALLYLMAGDGEAIELSYAGKPPARSRELSWCGAPDPQAAPWQGLSASEILSIEHLQRPYALVVLGPRDENRSPDELQALRLLCKATGEVLDQVLLQTRSQAVDFQEQRANRHHRQAKSLDRRLREVSHDLRNHLVPMLYATEELQELMLSARALKLLVTLERQIRLADQLSKASLQPISPVISLSKTDLAGIARAEAEAWQSAFARRQQVLTLQLPDAPVWVDGNPCMHHQVIGNLLSNAHKYTPPGGAIGLILTPHDGFCLLEVRDSGRGIGPTIRRRLFAAPVREDASIEGHGYGLLNVQAILEGLGGKVTVASQPGKGSRFRIRFRTHAEERLAPRTP
jgi:signal transduction histidine kinase